MLKFVYAIVWQATLNFGVGIQLICIGWNYVIIICVSAYLTIGMFSALRDNNLIVIYLIA